MALVSGLGTTYNLPNYTGIIYQLTPSDTPFLSAIGGISNGGSQTNSIEFEWQTFDLRNAGQNVALEGADAPAITNRSRANVTNITQIHHETVGVSYTKLAAVGAHAGLNSEATNPIRNELDWQVEQRLKEMARDIEYSFLRGTYVKPVDNSTARKTRGILEAITTNVVAAAGTQLDQTMILDLMQAVWDSGGIQESETATLIVNSYQKRKLTEAFIGNDRYRQSDRNVGGVNLTTIETDFGRVNVMLNRYMPADTVAVVSLEQCRPVWQEIPGKGHLFAEPLARTGATDRTQLYGEVGLMYGAETAHGKITGLATAPETP